jgi:hypothetical protein
MQFERTDDWQIQEEVVVASEERSQYLAEKNKEENR